MCQRRGLDAPIRQDYVAVWVPTEDSAQRTRTDFLW